MTIKEVYELAIQMGIKADPRGVSGVSKSISRLKKEYNDLPESRKKEFDRERLVNPYSDTRILFGDGSCVVDKILIGVDIDVGEIVLCDRLNQKGEGIDLVISHHPSGMAYAALAEVMDLQIDMMEMFGVPINVAEDLLNERIDEVARSVLSRNHFQTVDAARVLNIPFACVHTPCDNMGYDLVNKAINKNAPETVGEIVKVLKEIPEYTEATRRKAGPAIFTGNERSRAGKIVVGEFTGGTEGAKKLYEWLSKAGIGTIIGMHVSEEHRNEAKKHHINMVIAGHIASDSVGINLFIDQLEKNGITAIPCSGLIRVKRN